MQNHLDLQVALACQPWALESGALASIAALAEGGPRVPIRAASRSGARPGRGPAGTAIIPVVGPIQQRRGIFEALGLGTSCDTIAALLRFAIADPDIDRIVFDFDSPGGACFGVNELAAEIRGARGTKPVIAVANSKCASAAYWIASACSELYCTPGGQVGSIGVIAEHEDVSKALEMAGVNVKLITYGAFKAEGNPYGPLDEEALRSIQSDIDSYGADFTSAVSKGRNVPVETVRTGMGQGRMLRADAALAAGMIDGIATLDQVLNRRVRPGISRAIAASAYAGLPRALAGALRRLELLSI